MKLSNILSFGYFIKKTNFCHLVSYLLFIFGILALNQAGAQTSITYIPFYTEATLASKQVDQSKPVGVVLGNPGVSNGAASYSIPIQPSPRPSTLPAAEVSISYSSVAGDGIIGKGWTIGGISSIQRVQSTLSNGSGVEPSCMGNYKYVLDGQVLKIVAMDITTGIFTWKTEIENFSLIKSYSTNGADNIYKWEIVLKDGTIMYYGECPNNHNTRLFSANATGQNLDCNPTAGGYTSFYLDQITFKNGKTRDYYYTMSNNNLPTLSYIMDDYGKINFYYKNRTDKLKTYLNGKMYENDLLLEEVKVTDYLGAQIRKYLLKYSTDNVNSYLSSVEEAGSYGAYLNSTVFLYGERTTNADYISPQTPYMPTSFNYSLPARYKSGDFNGDGFSDYITLDESYLASANYGQITGYRVFINNQNGGYSLTETVSNLNSSYAEQHKGESFSLYSSDHNADGIDDLVTYKFSKSNNNYYYDFCDVRFFTESGYGNSSSNISINAPIRASYPSGTFNLIHPSFKFNYGGDFDGDGGIDQISILSNGSTYRYFITSYTKQLYMIDLNLTSGLSYNWQDADDIYVLDFDGDSKSDIMVLTDNSCSIYTIQYANSTYTVKRIYSSSFPNSSYIIHLGDFNGDRKTDLFYGKAYEAYKIALSTANNFEIQSSNVFQNNDKYPNLVKDNYSCEPDYLSIADFNGDGKSDILHIYEEDYQNKCESTIATFFSKGNGFVKKIYSGSRHYFSYACKNSSSGVFDITHGDYNGDGITDISSTVTYGVSANSSFFDNCGDGAGIIQYKRQDFYFNADKEPHLLLKVKDGFGSVTEFNYSTLSKLPITREFWGNDNYNGNYYYKVPFKVVSSFKDEKTNKDLSYSYYGAMMNTKGRGFLGYRLIEAKDNISQETLLNYNNYYSYILGFPDIIFNDHTERIKDGSIIEETRNYYVNGYSSNNSILWLKNTKTEIVSTYNGNREKLFTYDSYGNLLKEESTDYETTIMTENDYGTTASNRPALIDLSTVTYAKAGLPSISYSTKYKYNSNSQLTKKTEFFGLPNSIVSEFLYDNDYGQITESKVTGGNLAVRKTEYIYTSDDRFLQKKKNALEQETEYYMNSKWNVPISITDIGGLTTAYGYDAFGRPSYENLPSGKILYTNISWDNSFTLADGATSVYKITKSSTGSPTEEAYFDKRQVEIGKKAQQFNGGYKTWENIYDYKMRLTQVTNFGPSPSTQKETIRTEFDDFDRPKSQNVHHSGVLQVREGDLLASYEYIQGSGYWEIIKKVPVYLGTSTPNSERSFYTKKSYSGKILETKENGTNTLTYTYDAEGKPLKTISNGVVISEIVYDQYGRQYKLIDNSAGTQVYKYNALGEICEQLNPNDGFTKYEYDALGRKTKEITNEGTINYTYYSPTGEGVRTNLLKQVQGYNNQYKEEYDYDNLGRLNKVVKFVKGNTNAASALTFNYEYNDDGQLIKKITPLNTYEYGYNTYGFLNTIFLPYHNGGTTLYSLNSVHKSGAPESYTVWGQTTTIGYNRYAQPSSIQSANFNDSYSWDMTSGTLKSKNEDNLFNYKYEYDDFDRLTKEEAKIGSKTINNYMDFKDDGSPDGKFSVADESYEYHTGKKFAVKTLTTTYNFSPSKQNIYFTSFNKPYRLVQGDYELRYQYNHNYDRVGAELKKNGAVQYKRYYLDNTELTYDASGNIVSEIENIFAGNRMIAMYVKTPQTGGGINETFYRVHSDYLGNIRALSDCNSSTVYRQYFDAWGNYRDVRSNIGGGTNPNYGAISFDKPSDIPVWLYRGYTGHEHLPEFRLINMNARLYDPHVARMLSPDNYATSNTLQGLNRYTYANNNSLKYSDPDGNLPILVAFAIGAGIGLLSNGVSNVMSDRDFFAGNLESWAMAGIVGGMGGAMSCGIGSMFGAVGSGGVGGEILRAGAHGLSNGMLSEMSGGDFLTGFASGGISSSLGAAQMLYAPGLGDVGGYMTSGLGGAIGAELTGGDFLKGASIGLMVHGLNHLRGEIVMRRRIYNMIKNGGYEPTGSANFSNEYLTDFAADVFPDKYAAAGGKTQLKYVNKLSTKGGHSAETKSESLINIKSTLKSGNLLRLGRVVGHELIHAIDFRLGNIMPNNYYLGISSGKGQELYDRHIRASEVRAYRYNNYLNEWVK